jgi:hypothetical protein
VEEADVHEVVVAGDHDHLESAQPVEVLLRLPELGCVTLRSEVSGDHHEVRLEVQRFLDALLHQLRLETDVSTVDVGYLNDRKFQLSTPPEMLSV